MATQKEETKLQKKIQSFVVKNGGTAVKVHGNAFQRKGDPDLRGAFPVEIIDKEEEPFYRWVHFQIEAKVGDEQPTPIQLLRLAEWRELGYAAGIASSVEDFLTIIWAHLCDEDMYQPEKANFTFNKYTEEMSDEQ